MKTVIKFPSTFHSTLVTVWLGLAIGSKLDLRSVCITHHVKQVQYVEPQEDYIFLAS